MDIFKYKRKHKKYKQIKATSLYLTTIQFGVYGIKSLESTTLTEKQVETVRRILARVTKRQGRIFIRTFFNQAITKKPLLSRMGKGGGAIKRWDAIVKKGSIFIEITGVKKELAIKAFKSAEWKLPMKTIFFERSLSKN